MKKICIVCEANPIKCPRPKRLIGVLKDKFMLSVIGRDIQETQIGGVQEIFSYAIPPKRTAEQEEQLYQNIANKDYLKLVHIPTRIKIAEALCAREFDVIFCHDLVLLPIVLENKKNAKVIFDAREYYPRELEDDERWKRLFMGFNDWLCQTYLPQTDYVYTVNQGIADEYAKNYGIKCDVITSAAYYFAPPPNLFAEDSQDIKMLYHGMASPERGIETMIETMDYVDSRFTLDLMLVATFHGDYFQKLQTMVERRKNVRILPPVLFEEIIPFSSSYDIGFYILQPKNYNGLYALPNKFFEFIQARLAIAISPNPEMARLVKQYNLGIISKDFTSKSMAESLNSLTKEQILQYKENANQTAKILNAEREGEKILHILEEIAR